MKPPHAMVIAVCVAFVSVTAFAQSGPSARRVFLLCRMEDPECGTLLQNAYDEFLANPSVTECYTENFGGKGVYNQQQRCWTIKNVCHFVREPALSLQDIYVSYMQA